MKTIRNTLFVMSMLFTSIFYQGICFAQTENKVKQENKTELKDKTEAQNNDNIASERYIRNVKSFLKKQKKEWNEDQIQCAALYWQTAAKIAKKELDNDFVLLFMEIVNKSDKPKITKELAGAVVLRCTTKLQSAKNTLNDLQSQYEYYKKLEQITITSRSSSKSFTGDHNRIGSSLNDPNRDEKVKVMNQYNAAMTQSKRYTVYTTFAQKVQRAFNSSK
jgi:hypothetical protein